MGMLEGGWVVGAWRVLWGAGGQIRTSRDLVFRKKGSSTTNDVFFALSAAVKIIFE